MSLNPNLPRPIPSNEMEDLQEHSGQIWNCIAKYRSPHGGHIYHFVPKEKYDNFSNTNPNLLSRIANAVENGNEILPAENPPLEEIYRLSDTKKEIDHAVAEKYKEIFPAVEPPPKEVWHLCDDRRVIDATVEDLLFQAVSRRVAVSRNLGLEKGLDLEYLDEEHQLDKKGCHSKWDSFRRQREILNEVGYRVIMDEDHHLHLELPDLEALHNGWKHVQRTHPDLQLPDLDVVESKGIADDLSYAQAYSDHDALLSSGKEFVHDHTTHLMTRISRMLEGKENYEAEKERMLSLINNVRDTIQEAQKREEPGGILHREKEKLDFIVGFLTDEFFSFGENSEIKHFVNPETVELTLRGEILGDMLDNYLENRFGPGNTFETIADLWKEVRRLVPLKE